MSPIGTSGRRGDDVRSDCFVAVELRESGGVETALTSKVGAMYGEAIRAQVTEVLGQLGIGSAHVAIEDFGALPFTIAARLEAAARRAGRGGEERALPPPAPFYGASPKEKLRRSRLYLPGNEPKYFVNASVHRPDGIILDLEDSVHRDEKESARICVRNALHSVDFGGAERMVRINQLPLGFEDLDEIVPQLPDMILVPKVETAAEIEEIDRRIDEIQAAWHLDHPVWLMPILESALGIENAFSIAGASRRVAALTLGLEDYTADLGVVKTPSGDESLYARMRVVNAARAAGVQAIDSVWGDVADMEGLEAWGRRSRALGFVGMGCIHPLQIEVIHRAFAPGEIEIAKAASIVAAFEEAKARGLSVVSLGSKMVDPPVVLRALKLVEQAKAMGIPVPSTQPLA
jgi:citrate lyase subunit beta / citryl-CoA lyase